jgi:hypothetical protein
VRLGNVVECKDAIAEFEEEVCAEGDECPERKLWACFVSISLIEDGIVWGLKWSM